MLSPEETLLAAGLCAVLVIMLLYAALFWS